MNHSTLSENMNLGEEMRLDALKAMKELEMVCEQMCFVGFILICFCSFRNNCLLCAFVRQDDDSSLSSCTSDQIPKDLLQDMATPKVDAVSSDQTTSVRGASKSDLALRSSGKMNHNSDAVVRIRSSPTSSDGSHHKDCDFRGDSDSSHSDYRGTLSERGRRVEVTIDPRIHSHTKAMRRSSSNNRLANKVLGRLFSRRAFTAGLVFSRGHFLGDVSKMVAGKLSGDYLGDDSSFNYGFGEAREGEGDTNGHDNSVGDLTIHEREGDQLVVHSSTLAAGKDGCSVIVFPKAILIPFLDEYPGLLLSLLGTQVVV